MRIIHKAVIQICTRQVLRLPNSAIIRKVGMQGDKYCIWYEFEQVDTKTKDIIIHVVGTGHPEIANSWNYLDSIIDGGFVWHLYSA